MILSYSAKDGSFFSILSNLKQHEQNFFREKSDFTTHSILWNKGADASINIDGGDYVIKQGEAIALMLNQSYSFRDAEAIDIIQFNRAFYCIVNHDTEVGCVGHLFFGANALQFLQLTEEETMKLQSFTDLLRYEINSDLLNSVSVMRMTLALIIILLTRAAKRQYLILDDSGEQFGIYRQFNLLVEIHFRQQKQVQFYAGLLHKSPKTISNIFSSYIGRSPLSVIHERVVTEAKRLMFFTERSMKEIAFEIGFEDVAHFNKFIKTATGKTPGQIRKEHIEL